MELSVTAQMTDISEEESSTKDTYRMGGVWFSRGLEIWPKFAGDFGDFEL